MKSGLPELVGIEAMFAVAPRALAAKPLQSEEAAAAARDGLNKAVEPEKVGGETFCFPDV